MSKKVYVVLSQTTTFVAKSIRSITGCKYNHAAICFDTEFKELYAYARKQHHAFFSAGLVHESRVRYLEKNCELPVAVYELEITDEQYNWIRCVIAYMMNNKEYKYNLFSMLSYPILKGVKTYKAFTCSEFVAFILRKLGYLTLKESYEYVPEDIGKELTEYLWFEGDMRELVKEIDTDETYYGHYSRKWLYKDVTSLARLCERAFMSMSFFFF
ncbi:MAG: hypothetical protein J6U54_01960 [Clostridiales bacterium]|nr:hypothetical protein [Clostridiales bacterium]